MRKNKRGWIKIIEAFVAILLIAGVLLLIINKEPISNTNISSNIYELEVSILQEIQMNNTLRNEILGVDLLPVEWEDFESENLANVKNVIISKSMNYLNCEAKLCAINDSCLWNKEPGTNVYVKSGMIGANLEEYGPRQLKLFCWVSNTGIN